MALFGTPQATTIGSVDPEYENLVKQQSQKAREFRGNVGNLAGQQQAQARTQSRQKLAGTIAGIKRGSSKRGLLYSGLRQAGEAGAGAEAASNLAQRQQDINQNLEDKASALENQAIDSGLRLQLAKQQMASQNYAQQQEAKKNSGLSGILGTAGKLVGGLFG